MINNITSAILQNTLLSNETNHRNNIIFLSILKAQLMVQAQHSGQPAPLSASVNKEAHDFSYLTLPGRIPSLTTSSNSSLSLGDITSASVSSNLSSSPYEGIIAEKAQKHRMNPALIRAVIKTESNFNHKAVSRSGAKGLMQLMPGTAEGLGVSNPFDPEQNIDGGVRYLKAQLNRFNGNLDLALAAYNCGPGRVQRLGITNLNDPEQMRRLPKETQNYIKRVRQYLNSNT